MFDPERDDDSGGRRFYLRLLAVTLVAVAACAALLPSVTAFSAGVDQETGCLAIVDGWHADRQFTAAERDAEEAGFVGARPSPEEQQVLDRANAYIDWRNGPGACIPESRHRLILSGLGLGGLAAALGFVAIARRTRKNLRRSPAELAGA